MLTTQHGGKSTRLFHMSLDPTFLAHLNNCLAPAERKLPGSSAFKAVERLGSIQWRSLGRALASVAGFASRKLAGCILGKRRNDAKLAA